MEPQTGLDGPLLETNEGDPDQAVELEGETIPPVLLFSASVLRNADEELPECPLLLESFSISAFNESKLNLISSSEDSLST